jgi:hypothetical protein
MKVVLAFFLSLVLTLNAAYASVAGVCDLADHLSQGEQDRHLHVDHHSHADGARSPDDDGPMKNAKSCDNCHVHGSAVSIVSAAHLTLAFGDHVLSPLEAAPLTSVTAARLERPPRALPA